MLCCSFSIDCFSRFLHSLMRAMATLCRNHSFYLFLSLLSTLYALSFSFSPTDNYLLDCGSTLDSIVDNRRFVADSNSPFFSSDHSISIRSENGFPGHPQIYRTARVFERPSKYEFDVGEKGTHIVRLHFHWFNSSEFDFVDAEFHVLVNDYVVLSKFSGGEDSLVRFNARVREYLIWVDSEKLVIKLIPSTRSKFAFVNAIEVISAPKDLIADTAMSVTGEKAEKIDGLMKQALEVVYRISVGGPKVTPFNDTLWRTWAEDDEFLRSSDGSNTVHFTGRIKYQMGGASREVGPDNMYSSARAIKSKNDSIPHVNMRWDFPVMEGYKYLVRLHFCDIASTSVVPLFFDVYVNKNLAYQNLDLSFFTNYVLASPFYMDFVVDGDPSGVLILNIGPSSKSLGYAVDGILNGVEIMKMNNSMGSLDGDNSAKMILKSCPVRRNLGVLISMVAFVCILMSFYVALRRRRAAVDGFGWSKLPVDVPRVDSKRGNELVSRMP